MVKVAIWLALGAVLAGCAGPRDPASPGFSGLYGGVSGGDRRSGG